MSQSLISSLTESLHAATIHKVAVDSGASEEQVVSGFRSALAAILGSIVDKAQDPNGLQQMFGLIAGGTAVSAMLPSEFNREALATNKSADSPAVQRERLLSSIFGHDQSSVAEGISHHSGLSSDVVVRMMSMAAPMVLSLLRSRVKDQGISLSDLPTFLAREAGDLSSYMPASVHNMFSKPMPRLESSPGAVEVANQPSRNTGRILTAGLIAAVLFGIFWLTRRSPSELATTQQAQDVSRTRAQFSGLGSFTERELPGGVRMSIPENGMEAKLLSYVQGASRHAGREDWFDFDRLTFETNSAIPRPNSEEQLTNLASILKAYPQMRVKVGGYTDNSGDKRANQRLSENRAETVRRELIGMGVAPGRLEAEGYGDQHAIADNATEQGRAENRRISVRILQK